METRTLLEEYNKRLDQRSLEEYARKRREIFNQYLKNLRSGDPAPRRRIEMDGRKFTISESNKITNLDTLIKLIKTSEIDSKPLSPEILVQLENLNLEIDEHRHVFGNRENEPILKFAHERILENIIKAKDLIIAKVNKEIEELDGKTISKEEINLIPSKISIYNKFLGLVELYDPTSNILETLLLTYEKAAGLQSTQAAKQAGKDTNYLIRILIEKLLEWLFNKIDVSTSESDDDVKKLLNAQYKIVKDLIKGPESGGSIDAHLLDKFKEILRGSGAKKLIEHKRGEGTQQEFDKLVEKNIENILHPGSSLPNKAGGRRVIISNGGFNSSRFGTEELTSINKKTGRTTVRKPTTYNLNNHRFCPLSSILDPAPARFGGCTFAASMDDGYEYGSIRVILKESPAPSVGGLIYDLYVKLNNTDKKIIDQIDVNCNLPQQPNTSLNVKIRKEINIVDDAAILSRNTVFKNLLETFNEEYEKKKKTKTR